MYNEPHNPENGSQGSKTARAAPQASLTAGYSLHPLHKSDSGDNILESFVLPGFVEIIAFGTYGSSPPKSIKAHSSPKHWGKNGGMSRAVVRN